MAGEPQAGGRTQVPDASELEDLLRPGGRLQQLLPGYEPRPGQQRMLRAVAECFSEGGVLLVEAGTGVGKSLAYGLPAAARALSGSRPLVVSSATINLQQQLVDKDLPLIGRLLELPLRVELVKGRGNYLCRRRLLGLHQRQQMGLWEDDELAGQLADLTAWVETTPDGSRAGLCRSIDERLWQQVCSDSDACPGRRCPLRSECFFAAARRRAERAQLLVVNHHLLLADLAVRLAADNWRKRAVLPAFAQLVVDEAHELEDAASSFFGARITARGVARLLGRLSGRGRRRAGLVVELAAEIASLQGGLAAARSERLLEQADELSHQAQQVENTYRQGLLELRRLLAPGSAHSEGKLRLDRIGDGTVLAGAAARLAEGADRLRELADELERLVERLGDLAEEESRTTEALSWVAAARRLAEQTDVLMTGDDPGLVRWLEGHGDGPVSLHAAPVDLAPLFRRVLFEPLQAVVLTSATLTVEGHFDFSASRLGLDLAAGEAATLVVESPFDYRAQALLAAPADLPLPGSGQYHHRLPELITQAVAVSDGGALVLFTSWNTMHRVAARVAPRLEQLGLELMVQGQAERAELLQRFRDGEHMVLFGVDSFWQGIDVVGPALRQVVITRLPFDVPAEPLISARCELLESRGQSAFRDFTLPRAALRLKQGFGRLIRSCEDRGAVTLLDGRVWQRSYGRSLLAALPPARLVSGPAQEVFDELARFFGGSGMSRVVPLE